MTYSSEAVAEDQIGNNPVFGPPAFYVVSRKKLAVLYLATIGFYGIYWFYKNWSHYKNRISDSSIWPVPRAIFSIFFTHALFQEVKAHGYNKTPVAEWNNGSRATMLVVTMIVSNVLDRLSFRSIGSPYTDIASLLILAPLLTQLLSVQDMINASCDDPDGVTNSRFTKANYVWIVLGLIFWVLVVIGSFLPE